MKVESAELQLTEDNNEFFSGSFLSEQGWGTGRNKGKAVGPLDSDVPEAPLPSISHTGQGHTGRCACEWSRSRKSGLSSWHPVGEG